MNKFIGLVTVGASLALPAVAGVKSLSSDEMVDTYIRDSAIIVVPKQQEMTEEQRNQRERAIQSLTIAPGEPVVSESEEQQIQGTLRDARDSELKAARSNAEEQLIRDTLIKPLDEVARSQPAPEFNPNVPLIVYGQTAHIPDEPFAQTFLNDQLGLNYDGNQLTFSIGNPAGIDRINIPEAIKDGPIQLMPRPGGGFDLTIPVPQN
ncbi:MAG: hypothetical protein LPK85_10675 [Gammaproteobacteria bacterium]|nr:hypothetical protein [Gammaproteobacteria bacterium]